MVSVKVDKLKSLARQAEAGNREFRAFIKGRCTMPDEELDRLVARMTDEVRAGVDCAACARCCRELAPMFGDGDRQRLARRLKMTVEQFKGRCLVYEEDADGRGWRMKAMPCLFLEGGRCSVYEDRPVECREYPYLDKGNFSCRMLTILERTFTCPIVYEVLERLKEHFGFARIDPYCG